MNVTGVFFRWKEDTRCHICLTVKEQHLMRITPKNLAQETSDSCATPTGLLRNTGVGFPQ